MTSRRGYGRRRGGDADEVAKGAVQSAGRSRVMRLSVAVIAAAGGVGCWLAVRLEGLPVKLEREGAGLEGIT